MKELIIKDSRFTEVASLKHEYWYRCPNCEDDCIVRGDNYCCNCGVKIKWDLNKNQDCLKEEYE